MFYEAIYTRCRKGIDLKTGKEQSNDGFKVYSCSKELLSGDVVDIAYLSSEIQRVQSYSDPDFMDDAYLYYTPPQGSSFLIDFHPIKFDPTQEGDFAKRRGNIINQVLVGDFSDVYPFELFRDKEIWDAQERGEAYFYENDPTDLTGRDDIDSPPGVYSIDDIKAFVHDGRRETLKRAIAFLIKQFSGVDNKRQYLAILDDSATKIELWIAAIEYAFSPRIAANISFATRMDSFVNKNKIKQGEIAKGADDDIVNEIKNTFRAMIIGVVSSDRQNASLTRSAQTYGFALLDGTQKKAMFEEDTSNKYYDLVTSYNDTHIAFCREFIQTLGIDTPAKDLFALLRCYMLLADENLTPADYTKVIQHISRYPLHQTRMLQGLYNQANRMVDECVKTDYSSAIYVMNWIEKVATMLNDTEATSRLTEIVCSAFETTMFSYESKDETNQLWRTISSGGFAQAVSKRITDLQLITKNGALIGTANSEKVLQIAQIYTMASRRLSPSDEPEAETSKTLASYCAAACYSNKDDKAMGDLITVFRQFNGTKGTAFWLDVVKQCDADVAKYLLDNLLVSAKSVVTNEKELEVFCGELVSGDCGHMVPLAVKQYINNARSFSEIERVINYKPIASLVKANDYAQILMCADNRIGLLSGAINLAKSIQTSKQKGTAYPNSAHVLALDAIANKQKKDDLCETLSDYVIQGFPSINNDAYINECTAAIIKTKLTEKELLFLLKRIAEQPETYYRSFLTETNRTISKNGDLWKAAISVASEMKDEQMQKAANKVLASVLAECNPSVKAISKLEKYVDDGAYDFYRKAAKKATTLLEEQPKKGLLGILKK